MTSRILPIFALFISGFIFFAYISPTWNGPIAATQAAIESDKVALESAAKYEEKQQELIAQRDAIDAGNMKRLLTTLPDSVDNVGLILSLNTLASRSGLTLSSIDVAAQPASANAASNATAITHSSPVNSIDLSLSVTGTYAAFQKFLMGIEQSQRLLDVKTLNVAGSNNGLYTYQMTLRIYWLR